MARMETVAYRIFKGMFKSRDTLCAEAAAFATELGREKLITINAAADNSATIVTVFYWE